MEIEGPGGERLAMVKKALITPVRERWTANIGDGPDLERAPGRAAPTSTRVHHRGGPEKVAECVEEVVPPADTYEEEIAGPNDIRLILRTPSAST